MSQDGQRKHGFAPADFFVLRTPLRPFSVLAAFGDDLLAPAAAASGALDAVRDALTRDRVRQRDRLRALVADPVVREAVFLASPSLDESISAWLQDATGERGQKVERALFRYLSRLSARPTPFGLFAGCSVGTLAAETRLELEAASTYARHSRLDMYYVCALIDALVKEPALRRGLRYRPNTSLYRSSAQLRYVEARMVGAERTYHLAVVEPAPYLERTLARAAAGVTPEALAAALVTDDPDVSSEEALAYVDELIDAQLLVPVLAAPVTGPEPIVSIIEVLRAHPAGAALAQQLSGVAGELERFDAGGAAVSPERYRALAASLESLPLPAELPRLFQVDLVKPAPRATLGPQVIEEVQRAVGILHRMTAARPEPGFVQFRAAFEARYGQRELPLAEVLDEESGIGFETVHGPSTDASPLLAGLSFGLVAGAGESSFGARDAHLLGLLEAAWRRGAGEIELGEEDLAAMSEAAAPLPDSFAALASVSAASGEALRAGRFQVHVDLVFGPSGASVLGRFCHADPALHRHVRRYLDAEAAQRPDVIYAEIVHLPEGRIGNVLSRPLVRDYEIVYLGASGAPDGQQISIDDLRVSLQGERIVLRSARLGREVVPRLTNAHNYAARSLGLYRFLCALQRQGVSAGMGWSWGPLARARFLPRVRMGRVILSPARWHLAGAELRALVDADAAAAFVAVQRLRATQGLPRWVSLVDGDNLFPLDLDSALSIDALGQLARGQAALELIELRAGADDLCAEGPEGRFVHELVIPFNGSAARPVPDPQPGSPLPAHAELAAPGSDWLYASLFAGPATIDRVLHTVVGPIIDEATRAGLVDRWFFLRYGDPEWHLRLRLHGARDRLAAELLPRLHEATRPLLEDGRAWKLQLDTYDPELHRYGGAHGVVLAERLFAADSSFALEMLGALRGEANQDQRWRITLRAVDALLDDLRLSLPGKLALLEHLREQFGREFGTSSLLEKQLGDRFRKERPRLDALFALTRDHADGPSVELRALELLALRSARLAPVVDDLVAAIAAGAVQAKMDDLAASYIHMHVNRMTRSAARAHELVLYDFLSRIYRSQTALAKKGRASAAADSAK